MKSTPKSGSIAMAKRPVSPRHTTRRSAGVQRAVRELTGATVEEAGLHQPAGTARASRGAARSTIARSAVLIGSVPIVRPLPGEMRLAIKQSLT